jgi:hypothetical protein
MARRLALPFTREGGPLALAALAASAWVAGCVASSSDEGASGRTDSGSSAEASKGADETPDSGGARQGGDLGNPGQSEDSGDSAGQSADSGHESNDEGGRDSGASQEADAACAPPVSPVVETDPDGPGYDCMTSGCHLPGVPVQGGLTITVSGTLYDAKGKPLPGATVYVTDSVGKGLVLTSDNNANFWSGYSDGKVMPAGNYGTCLSYVMCYPPSQFEGACQCATYAATGALKTTSVSMCPNATASCGSLGTGANNGDCHSCHGTTGSSPAIRLP